MSALPRQTRQDVYIPPAWQLDPAGAKRFALVYEGYLIVYGSDPAQAACLDIEDLQPQREDGAQLVVPDLKRIAEIALREHCAAVWCLDDLGWSAAARALLHQADQLPYTVHEISSGAQLAGLVLQRRARGATGGKGRGMPIGLYFLRQGDAWGLAATLRTALGGEGWRTAIFSIAEGLNAAAWCLGAQLRFSPSYTGLAVLRQTLGRKPYELPQLSPWARELVLAHRPTYVQWARPMLVPKGQTHLSLFKYDRNSSFVASAGEVPVGDPIRTGALVRGKPGLYHILAIPPSLSASRPGPFHTEEGAGLYPFDHVKGWAWEPQIRLAQRQGWEIDVLEGWYWPVKHDVFRVWRERLRDARARAEDVGGLAGQVAASVIKRAGVATIGRLLQRHGHAIMDAREAVELGMEILGLDTDAAGELTGFAEVETDLGRADLIRPEWWSTIIANANERLFSTLYDHLAYQPVGAYVDAVYCLRPWPQEEMSRQLGKWKLERVTRVLPDEVARLNVMSPYEWVSYVKQLERVA